MEYIYGLLGWFSFAINVQAIQDWGISIVQSDYGKWTIAFLLAERVHRRGMRKDMTVHFESITKAIDNVADKVSKDLSSHSNQLGLLKSEMSNLTTRVSKLETTKG